MKRSTWIAVAVASAVLVLAGQLPRLPWETAWTSWRGAAVHAVAAWPSREHRPVARGPARTTAPAARALAALRAPVAPQWRARVAFALDPSGPIAAAVAGAAGGLVLLALLTRAASVLWPGRFGRVRRLARAGLGVAEIARHVRMPHDAVRTLLAAAPEPPPGS